LPAPGGATSTIAGCARTAAEIPGKIGSIGNDSMAAIIDRHWPIAIPWAFGSILRILPAMTRILVILHVLLLCLLGGTLCASAVPATSATATTQSFTESPVTAPATAAASAAAVPAEDDSAPGLGIFALLAIIAFVILVVLSVVLLVVAGIGLLILIFFGVFSFTLLYGLLRRSVTAATRALIIQLLALCGIPVGILLVYVVSRLGHLAVHGLSIFVLGIVVGAAGGGAIGYLFTKSLSLLFAAITKRRKPVAPVPGRVPLP
jgi:hypothetical protein